MNFRKWGFGIVVFTWIIAAIFGAAGRQAQAALPPPDQLPAEPPPPGAPEIVGGTQASAGQFPWQVAIVDANNPDSLAGQYCGGSLISTGWVLTAAHCFVDQNSNAVTPAADVNVVLGQLTLSVNDGQRLGVSQIIIHPSYVSSGKTTGDMALLQLASAAALNSNVAPIPLANASNAAQMAPGVIATVSGWGHTTFGGSGSDALLFVNAPVVSNQDCAASGYGSIVDAHICAGGEAGKDSCQGDSGGPLVAPNDPSGFLLIGVVSYGPSDSCGAAGKPGVYERVSAYNTWINEQTGVPGGGGGGNEKTYLPFTQYFLEPTR